MTIPWPSVWGLILSRQGSTRLPGKAMLPLNGQPLISYTFAAARNSQRLTQTWLFSNDPDVLALATTYAIALPPFSRPAALSQATTDTWTTVQFFLQQFAQDALPDLLLLLQPTSPLRSTEDIDGIIRFYTENQPCDYALSVHRPLKPPHWTYWMDPEDATLRTVLPRREGYVFPNGALYLFDPRLLLGDEGRVPLEQRALRVKGYEMPWQRSLDVDLPVDLGLAEWILSQPMADLPKFDRIEVG